MGKLDGKVAFITGVARGQGRSHAVRLASEGAHIIGVDLMTQIASVRYPMATHDELAETVRLVEAHGVRMVAAEADVRDGRALRTALDAGHAELGRVDIVVANAGICVPTADGSEEDRAWQDTIDVNLTGVYHTVRAALPAMTGADAGGSIVLISSIAALKGFFGAVDGEANGGPLAYTASKAGVTGLMRSFATMLAPHGIRVNSIHPSGVATPMVVNDAMTAYLSDHVVDTRPMEPMLPVEMLAPSDITDAVLWLASDESRYVTGVALPVDAGTTLR